MARCQAAGDRGSGGGESRRPNRLIDEKSPYLLQHAHNPVDWYPWGDEAFERARAEDKPIFLSIGYSTCHWCHVMERESFEDAAIATAAERAVRQHQGRSRGASRRRSRVHGGGAGDDRVGGWPLSVWLTHELEPFYAGTYFAPDNRYGRPGFSQVLLHLSEAWRHERPKVIAAARQVSGTIAQMTGESADRGAAGRLSGSSARSGVDESAATFEAGARARGSRQLARSYEPRHGGFVGRSEVPASRGARLPAPSSPADRRRDRARHGAPHPARDVGRRHERPPRWRLPPLLGRRLLAGAALREDALRPGAARIVAARGVAARARRVSSPVERRSILDYVRRRPALARGRRFFSAEDADSAPDATRPEHKEEGAFYLWESAEIEALLSTRSSATSPCVHAA